MKKLLVLLALTPALASAQEKITALPDNPWEGCKAEQNFEGLRYLCGSTLAIYGPAKKPMSAQEKDKAFGTFESTFPADGVRQRGTFDAKSGKKFQSTRIFGKSGPTGPYEGYALFLPEGKRERLLTCTELSPQTTVSRCIPILDELVTAGTKRAPKPKK